MGIEAHWLQQREAFLARARQAKDDQELLSQYRMLMEQLKTQAMSGFPHDDVLRQQIALLFSEAEQGAELLLAHGQPVVERREGATGAKKASPALRLLTQPAAGGAVAAAGLVFSLLAGRGAWRCAPFFAVALGLCALSLRAPAREGAVSVAVAPLRIEFLDGFILRQAQLLDRHIEDLRLLLQDALAPASDVSLDPITLSLCQYVWAFANSNYPAESARGTAEKLLRTHDIAWVEYEPGLRNYFDVMPTKNAAHTVYPALRKISDGTLVCRGQYVEPRAQG